MKTVFTYQTAKKERVGYYSYFVGQNMTYMFITLYLSIYYTTTLGIPAAAVGTILLVARVWDAVNDPLLSILVEKSNLKGGKFKPWIKSVAFLIPLLTVLSFSFSNQLIEASMSIRIGYATVTYILWGMAYTISDAPAYALGTVMSDNSNEKNILISLAKFSGVLGLLIAMIISPILVELTNESWLLTSIIISVMALLFLLQIGSARERISTNQHSPNLKDILGAIFNNKYLVIIVITMIFMNGFNFGMTTTPFLAEYVFGDKSLMPIIMGVGMLPMMFGAPFLPRFAAKFGKNPLLKFSLIAIFLTSTLTYFMGYNSFGVFITLTALKGILSCLAIPIGTLYFADCIEYDFCKKGTRFEAAVFSAQTFSAKAISAIAGAGAMWLLAAFGFKESIAGETIIQTQNAIEGIWSTFTLGPAIGAFFALIFFTRLYDLDEKKLKEMSLKKKSDFA